MYHLKKKLKDADIYKKCFPGVNANHLNHQILPTLYEDQPDAAIIHVGINDILNGIDVNYIVNEIGKVGITCKQNGVNDVIISGVTYSRRVNNAIIDEVNKKLEELCLQHDFFLMNNKSIQVEDLCKDGLHQDKSGKMILFENIYNFLDYFLKQEHLN